MRKHLAALLFLVAISPLLVDLVFTGPRATQTNIQTNKPFTEEYLSGSVVFWQDGILIKPIKRHTGSNITHAAIILNGFVYEAVPPRVHKIPLFAYLNELEAKKLKPAMQKRGFQFFILQPNEPYTPTEIKAMSKYAESQIGRPYQLRGYGRKETRGIFCSALVANILEQGGRIESGSYRESPGSLFKKLTPLYQ